MNQYLKKGLITSASVLMFLSVGTGINNVQARRYHYRTHYRYRRRSRKPRYRRHYRRYNKKRRTRKARRHTRRHTRRRRVVRRRARRHWYHISTFNVDGGWTTNYRHYRNEMNYIHRMHKEHKLIKNRDGFDSYGYNSQGFNSEGYNPNPEGFVPVQLKKLRALAPLYRYEMKVQTLLDMNKDRAAKGVAPLKDSPLMDKIAAIRARQIDVPGDFTHYDYSNNKKTYEDEDAAKLGINPGYAGENIAAPSLGMKDLVSSQDYDDSPAGNPDGGTNHNGYDMADEAENAMFNYDASQNWGHRDNILNPYYRYVGIGVHTSKSDPAEYTLSEDFTNGASNGVENDGNPSVYY